MRFSCLCNPGSPQVFQFPDDVGVPVGGDHSETHYRLEIHYNNAKMETGESKASFMKYKAQKQNTHPHTHIQNK